MVMSPHTTKFEQWLYDTEALKKGHFALTPKDGIGQVHSDLYFNKKFILEDDAARAYIAVSMAKRIKWELAKRFFMTVRLTRWLALKADHSCWEMKFDGNWSMCSATPYVMWKRVSVTPAKLAVILSCQAACTARVFGLWKMLDHRQRRQRMACDARSAKELW